jgi:hypothetical protein
MAGNVQQSTAQHRQVLCELSGCPLHTLLELHLFSAAVRRAICDFGRYLVSRSSSGERGARTARNPSYLQPNGHSETPKRRLRPLAKLCDTLKREVCGSLQSFATGTPDLQIYATVQWRLPQIRGKSFAGN